MRRHYGPQRVLIKLAVCNAKFFLHSTYIYNSRLLSVYFRSVAVGLQGALATFTVTRLVWIRTRGRMMTFTLGGPKAVRCEV